MSVAERSRGLLDRLAELAEKGEPLDRRLRMSAGQAGKALEELADRAGQTVSGLGTLLRDTLAYESRRTLRRLNVATSEDLKVLASRLDTLSKKLDELAAARQRS
jgi:ubiquinone biosynthesis protein UbiJ